MNKVKAMLRKWMSDRKRSIRLRANMFAMALASLLTLSAFADSGAGGSSSGFSAVWGSFDDLGTLMSKVWSMMTANPLLTIMLAVLLLAVGGGAWLEFYSIDDGFGEIFWSVLMGIVALVTIASGAGYFIRNKKLYLESLSSNV